MTRTIALMNQKGGVGKTTTTVNLGAGLAQLGARVLLVDLDPQAHLTLHVGVDPAQQEASVYDLLLDEHATAASVTHRVDEQLAVIGAEVDLAGAEQELSGRADRSSVLKDKLAKVKDQYDFVLLDCPPSLGLLTVNALTAADEVIVPMQAHFLALQGMSKLLETVQLVRQGMNTQLRVSGVVLAMHEAQTNLAGEVVEDLKAFFAASRKMAMPWSDAQIYQPPIRRNIKLAECPSFGQTIFQYAPTSAGAQDYAALAACVSGRAQPEPEAHEPAAIESAEPAVASIESPETDDAEVGGGAVDATAVTPTPEQPGKSPDEVSEANPMPASVPAAPVSAESPHSAEAPTAMHAPANEPSSEQSPASSEVVETQAPTDESSTEQASPAAGASVDENSDEVEYAEPWAEPDEPSEPTVGEPERPVNEPCADDPMASPYYHNAPSREPGA